MIFQESQKQIKKLKNCPKVSRDKRQKQGVLSQRLSLLSPNAAKFCTAAFFVVPLRWKQDTAAYAPKEKHTANQVVRASREKKKAKKKENKKRKALPCHAYK